MNKRKTENYVKKYLTLGSIFSASTNKSETGLLSKYERVTEAHPFFIELMTVQTAIHGDDFELNWNLPFSDHETLSDLKSSFCIPFMKDTDGNSFHVYDFTQEHSPIIFKSHDPAVLIVVAESMCDFLDNLHVLAMNNPQKLISNLFKKNGIWEDIDSIAKRNNLNFPATAENGLKVTNTQKSIIIDLANAKLGSGINLSYFGDLTRIRRNLSSKTISLIQPSKNEILQRKKDNIISRALLLGVPMFFASVFSALALTKQMSLMETGIYVVSATLLCSLSAFFAIFFIMTIYFAFPKS